MMPLSYNFFSAIGSCLVRYAELRGRACRTELWCWLLPWLVINAGLYSQCGHPELDAPGCWDAALQIFQILTLPPTLAVSARRLHDTGLSAWPLICVFIPILGWLALVALFCSGSGPANRYGAASDAPVFPFR